MPKNPFNREDDESSSAYESPRIGRHNLQGVEVNGNAPGVGNDLQDLGIPGAKALQPKEGGLQKAGRIFGNVMKFI